LEGNDSTDTTVGHVGPGDAGHGEPDGVNWHRQLPAAQAATVGEDGRLPLTELTFDRAGAASPFGDDVTFPLPNDDLNYHHPREATS
jgi:succinate dehydrogenase / fumarate reductase iron-sulfur subunit